MSAAAAVSAKQITCKRMPRMRNVVTRFMRIPSKRETRLQKPAVDSRHARSSSLIPIFELDCRKRRDVVTQSGRGPGKVRDWLEDSIGLRDMAVFESIVRLQPL